MLQSRKRLARNVTTRRASQSPDACTRFRHSIDTNLSDFPGEDIQLKAMSGCCVLLSLTNEPVEFSMDDNCKHFIHEGVVGGEYHL